MKNDKVDGLKAKVIIDNDSNNIKKLLNYTGKYGQGYDGCGVHTHK